jgi:hypothetical protein
MKGRLFSSFIALTLGASLMLLCGCGTGTTAPSRFYVLSATSHPSDQSHVPTAETCLAIGIGPVEVAPYLDRPQIVTRLSPNELKLGEFDKWAEPLKDNITRVLAEDLSNLLCTDPIVVFPWRGATQVDYRVEVEVLLLDGKLRGNASLLARWAIFDEERRNILFNGKSRIDEPTDGQDYKALVSSQSRAIGALSKEIAEGLRTVMR